MSQEKRVRARIKGISVAAKVATVGGIAVAALALVEARAAASDTERPSEETILKVNAGNCGCAPCWGPPAPPAKRGRARARARTKRGAR